MLQPCSIDSGVRYLKIEVYYQDFPFRNQNLSPVFDVSNSHIEFSAYSQRSKLPRA